MSGGASRTTGCLPSSIELARRLHPEGAGALADAHQAAWSDVDPLLLELCRIRVAAMLGDEAAIGRRTPAAEDAGFDESRVAALDAWDEDERFSEYERAHLAFTEQFVTSVGHISEADVDRLLGVVDPADAYAFAQALYVLEMSTRLDIALRSTFSDDKGVRDEFS